MKVKEKDVEAVKVYLNYISHLDGNLKKSMLNDFLRRHVQDVNFDPFVSEEAVKLLKKNKVTSQILKEITWPWKSPGSGVPENLKPLFTNSAKGKAGSKKIFHFEHNIPACQGAEKLAGLKLNAANIDSEIKNVLASCTLCLITCEEDGKLNEKKWIKNRPLDAYNQLGIKLIPRSEAYSKL